MARKKARTTVSSHLHDESASSHPHPYPSRTPNPNPVGAEQTPSGNHMGSISGGREKQKKKKEKSSCYEIEPSVPSAAEEWGVSSPSPKRLEDERQGRKMVKNKKQLEGHGSPQKNYRGHHLCHWCFRRRALWHLFLHQSPTRRPRKIRVILRRTGNKLTKTTTDLENQSQGYDSKRRKTDQTADVGDSSVSVQKDSMTEPDNDSYALRDIMTDPDDYISEVCQFNISPYL